MTALASGPTPPPTGPMAVHVSHEMERLLWIGELQRRWGCVGVAWARLEAANGRRLTR